MKSVMKIEKECYVCGRTYALEEHHIFGASNRKLSEKYGLKVWLCHWHHNEPPDGVHFNRENELKLKSDAQRKFTELYPWEDFRAIFGRSWVDE